MVEIKKLVETFEPNPITTSILAACVNQEETRLRKSCNLQEDWNQFGLFGNINPWFFGGADNLGNFWNTISYSGSTPGNANFLLYIFASPTFNRYQRWIALYLYKISPIAIAAVNNLVTLCRGSGFKYVAKSKSAQEKLDKFIEEHKFHDRMKEADIKCIVTGECFIRYNWGEDTETKLRFLLPDCIYGNTDDDQYANGIITNPDDYEEVEGYLYSSAPNYAASESNPGQTVIPADDVQHRAFKSKEEKRGTSLLFPVTDYIVNAETLLTTLSKGGIMRAKFAMFREWDSPSDSVQQVRSNIQANQAQNNPYLQNWYDPNNPLWLNNQSNEFYNDATIVDLPKNMTAQFPNANLEADKFVEVIKALYRAISARMSLPEFILGGQGDMAAYTAALAAESPSVKAMVALQEQFKEWDCELLESLGFKDIEIEAPEISVHNKKELVEVANFLKTNLLASDTTVAKMFEVDLDSEREIMALQPQSTPDQEIKPNGEPTEKEASTVDKLPEEKDTYPNE